MIKFLYFFAYIILVSFALAIFWILRPVTYFDNFKSQIVCSSGTLFSIGPNSIFSLNGKFDQFNDKKARKICQYGIIYDYKEDFKTPEKLNYTIKSVIREDSDFVQAGLVSGLFFLAGAYLIKFVTKNDKFMSGYTRIAVFIFSFSIFLIILRKPASLIYCKRAKAIILSELEKSARKGGRELNQIEVEHLKIPIDAEYKNCLKKERIL